MYPYSILFFNERLSKTQKNENGISQNNSRICIVFVWLHNYSKLFKLRGASGNFPIFHGFQCFCSHFVVILCLCHKSTISYENFNCTENTILN